METDICIVGGGPAGCVLGTRLAQFGLKVCLVEKVEFPRRHLGESLSPGVLPLLASIGASPAIERAGFSRVRKVSVRWEAERERLDPSGQGMLVDRGIFDQLLLEHARAAGVYIIQPGNIYRMQQNAGGWNIALMAGGKNLEMRARFLADASGRTGVRQMRRTPTAPRTVALHAYWTGAGLPEHPRIEAGADAWYWGVPLPDGVYNTLAFVDARELRERRGSLREKFLGLLAASSLLPAGVAPERMGVVQACDATSYIDGGCVTADAIKVGDAAVALDPISSSGVQKAIQSALAGAVVVNTLLQRPEAAELARQFYRNNIAETSTRHLDWTRRHYSEVAALRPARFWRERAAGAVAAVVEMPPPVKVAGYAAWGATPVSVASDVTVVELPCVVDRYIETRAAVCAPALGNPVAFLGNCELVPLLRGVRPGMTLLDVIYSWGSTLPRERALAMAQWLVARGVLVADGPRQPAAAVGMERRAI